MAAKTVYTSEDIYLLKSGETYTDLILDELAITNKDLQDCAFTNCSFINCDFSGTKFNGSIFNECNFSSSKIVGTNFFSSTFAECKLMGLSFPRVASLIGVEFKKCIFDYSDMRGLDLSGFDLSHSSFVEADLSLCNLEKTSLINSQLVQTIFDGAKFSVTDLRGATLQGIGLKTHNLKGVIITPQQLEILAQEIGITVLEATE